MNPDHYCQPYAAWAAETAAELVHRYGGWYQWHPAETAVHARGPQLSCACEWCVMGLSCCQELMHV